MTISLVLLFQATNEWAVFLIAALFGLAYGSIAPCQSPLIADLFGLQSHGLILAATDVCFTLGAAVGPLLSGYLFDINMNYKFAIIICAILSFIGILSVLNGTVLI